MNSSSSFSVKLISFLGWILTVFGGLFAVLTFILVLGEKNGPPMMILFFFIFIFCSVAIGQFFVVLSVIVNKLQNIEANTNAMKELLTTGAAAKIDKEIKSAE
ncbi:hypothetical protein AZ34_10810 [Hylemonella gracilis str. Niagara R]|uniref:DUF4282 domain-containing protein n=2 Tax=Hylemonella gracilis TaxID=80880 RepID=A0A016XNT2_9BURK|nr:hypothetical protein AZ34_10810 [Hylemonella gracilis str. Niagara R]